MSINNPLLKTVRTYDAYIVTGHGDLEIHEDDQNLFIKVPKNLIVMLSFDDIDVSMLSHRNEREFLRNITNNKYYIQDSLLVHNDDLDRYHYLKNKSIYMPGSCIPDFYFNLKQDSINSCGIYNANNLEIKNGILHPVKIVYKHLIKDNIRLSEILKDMNKGKKKILFINICYSLYISYDKDKNTHVIISEEFVKFLRECQLDSLEKFTKKFKYFKKENIPEYLTKTTYDRYFTREDVNKIRNRRTVNDVSQYFSTFPPPLSPSSLVLNSFIPSNSNYSSSKSSYLSGGGDIDKYNTLKNDVLSTKFNKMLSENIKKILPVSKSVRAKLRKFNQSLRKKNSTKRKRKSSSLSVIKSSSSKNLRRSKRFRINSKKV
jgi:hypothetical protein